MLRCFNISQVNAGMHLAFLLKTSGQRGAALEVYRELYDLPNLKHHANFVTCIADWVLLLEANGEIHEAEQVLKKELQQSSETLGDVDTATLQLSSCLARFLQRKGSTQALEEAEQLHRKVWEIRCVVNGEQHPLNTSMLWQPCVHASRERMPQGSYGVVWPAAAEHGQSVWCQSSRHHLYQQQLGVPSSRDRKVAGSRTTVPQGAEKKWKNSWKAAYQQ